MAEDDFPHLFFCMDLLYMYNVYMYMRIKGMGRMLFSFVVVFFCFFTKHIS